jgi:processive 1,2-diacylglycerol beta-glucosyltransferase
VILILTAGFGDGHNTAAQSVAQSLRQELVATGEQVLVVDLFAETLPLTTRLLQQAYQLAIVQFPALWRFAYRKLANSAVSQESNQLNRVLQRGLERLLDQHQPRCLVSTYPFYSTLLRPLRGQRPVPRLVTIITDSVSVHPSWTNDPSDFFCVADQETSDVLQQRGIPAQQIAATGFPVSPRFATPLERDTAPARQSILYLPSTPVRHVAATLDALRPIVLAGAKLTLPAGKHQSRLFHPINRFADAVPPDRFEMIGWTDRMPDLLRSHDLVICKAGGAILHEVLAARIPPVIDYVVPGQEEGNAEMILRHHCGLRSTTPLETAAAASRLLADDGKLAKTLRARMVPPLSLPDAARQTALTILSGLALR